MEITNTATAMVSCTLKDNEIRTIISGNADNAIGLTVELLLAVSKQIAAISEYKDSERVIWAICKAADVRNQEDCNGKII